MIITDETQKEILLEAGKRLRTVLDAVREHIQPGVATIDLDRVAYTMITERGDTPTFLNYKPSGMKRGFPATLCVSLNDQMVHGVPNPETYVRDGDIISVDCGLCHRGIFVDAAYSMVVGDGDNRAHALVEATRNALKYAMVTIHAGATTGDFGSAVETVANENGYTVPPELGGHGVGAAQHESPFIPNVGDPGQGDTFCEGQVIAVEPIFSEGADPRIALGDDGFAYSAADGSRSAHFEHTLLVTTSAPVIVTGPMW